MKIAYRIQHAAGRDAALARLVERLPPAVEVVTDELAGVDPNPLRNYLRCLEDIPNGVTHVCVLQDDALPCKGFGLKLNAAVEERPNDVISLFVGGLPGRTRRDFYTALKSRASWSPIAFRETHHVVALVWPVVLAKDFIDWIASDPKLPIRKPYRSDDAVVTHWVKSKYADRRKRITVMATVPCLVEHPDDLPSLVQGNRKLGDAGRRAIAFADDL